MLTVRRYGPEQGRRIFVLHGGPGAAGYMRPVAQRLGERFPVLEPLQRGSAGTTLSVARHVEDLHEFIVADGAAAKPVLLDSSWGR